MRLYRGYVGIMEKKMEATILGFRVPGPPKVCRIMAFYGCYEGVGLSFYILLGFR